jgi:hypothetical protein
MATAAWCVLAALACACSQGAPARGAEVLPEVAAADASLVETLADPATAPDASDAAMDTLADLPDGACGGWEAEPSVPVVGEPADCAHSPIQCSPRDFPLVNPPCDEEPGVGGCPPGMLPVEAFCMDRYEATLVEVLPDGSLGPWSPFLNPAGAQVVARSVAGAVPQGYINQVQAGAACQAAGKRLCTDAEWKRACGGPGGTTYPYGASLEPDACNDARACHPAVQLYETGRDWIWSELDNPCLNQLPQGLAPAGGYPACVSAEGVFDLVGNLHEWTADPAGTFRGGFYVDTKGNGAGCAYVTTAHPVTYWDYSTGFRCCAER